MDSIKIVLPFCPSSNTAYPTIVRGGKSFRIKSAKLKEWIRDAPDLEGIEVSGKVTISYMIFFPDNRIRDGQNYMKVPLDYLVSQGVLKDDNRKYVCGEQWYDGGNDKENPRIEITIKEIV